jgi:hypothetical protein
LVRTIYNHILKRAVARPAERGAIAEGMTPAQIAESERLARCLSGCPGIADSGHCRPSKVGFAVLRRVLIVETW